MTEPFLAVKSRATDYLQHSVLKPDIKFWILKILIHILLQEHSILHWFQFQNMVYFISQALFYNIF